MTEREEILYRAAELITGDRQADYGDLNANFGNIAAGWSVISGSQITSLHVALMMDWLKTCRLLNSPLHEDSIIDKAGYTGLYGEIARNEKKRSAGV